MCVAGYCLDSFNVPRKEAELAKRQSKKVTNPSGTNLQLTAETCAFYFISLLVDQSFALFSLEVYIESNNLQLELIRYVTVKTITL